MRIAVIGTQKSGKTTLVSQFENFPNIYIVREAARAKNLQSYPPFAEGSTGTATEAGGDCSNINPDIGEFGSLKVTLLHQGSPAKNVEVDLAKTPGPDNYCYQITDDNGVVEFGSVPVGSYYIYLNMSNYPEEYGIPSAETIGKDTKLEVTLELTDY